MAALSFSLCQTTYWVWGGQRTEDCTSFLRYCERHFRPCMSRFTCYNKSGRHWGQVGVASGTKSESSLPYPWITVEDTFKMPIMLCGEGNMLYVYIFIESWDERKTFTGGCGLLPNQLVMTVAFCSYWNNHTKWESPSTIHFYYWQNYQQYVGNCPQ